MATNFKYASISDLTKYFGRVSDFDSKRELFGGIEQDSSRPFTNSVDVYLYSNVGYVSSVYRDNNDLGSGKQTIGTTAITAINGTFSSSVTQFDCDSTSGLTDETYIKIGDEILLITAIADGTTFHAQRAKFGTVKATISDDTSIFSHFNPSTDGQFLYDEDNDFVAISVTNGTNPTDSMIEAGEDFKTFMDQSLVDASLELHNYLDMRYSTPLQKIKQTDIDTAGVSIEEEYDPIIIKSVCYIASANLIRAKEGASEEADYYYSLVTNPEKSGLLDKLNDGIYKLSFEVDANDKKGSIKYRNVSGTMDLVELAGEYSGEPYDLLKIEVEATGAYGVSTFKVHHFSDDKIFGDVTTPEIITGGLQHIYGGLSGRFQGASATDGDIWEVEVVSSHRKQTNKSNATIEMRR